jgi:hypothetical protein
MDIPEVKSSHRRGEGSKKVRRWGGEWDPMRRHIHDIVIQYGTFEADTACDTCTWPSIQ